LDLSKVEVETFLQELGLNNVQDEGTDVIYSCFSDKHIRGDANPSGSMHKKTTAFQCWSCGMKGNAITFLAELENVSPIQAAIWIKERFNIGTVPKKETIVDNVKEILSKKKATKTPSYALSELDESEADRRMVDWFQLWEDYENHSSQLTELPGTTWEDIFNKQNVPSSLFYMFNRGFKPETLTNWKIGWDKISERISIPVRNENGGLVGFKGRTIKKENPRYLVLGGIEYGFEPYETKKVLFGLNEVNKNEELIVREGELNVISLHEKGIKNSAGISGKVLTSEQAELCKKYCEKLILWFDDEEDAINAAKKSRTTIPTYVVPTFERDPVEMTRGEILSLLAADKSALL